MVTFFKYYNLIDNIMCWNCRSRNWIQWKNFTCNTPTCEWYKRRIGRGDWGANITCPKCSKVGFRHNSGCKPMKGGVISHCFCEGMIPPTKPAHRKKHKISVKPRY